MKRIYEFVYSWKFRESYKNDGIIYEDYKQPVLATSKVDATLHFKNVCDKDEYTELVDISNINSYTCEEYLLKNMCIEVAQNGKDN